ncbi:MAG: exosome complex RNA-binding protein Csl4 [Candidatus Korarchaeota archaeon]|nr:exosome complex RNA-binding protein Csl4 [Candidatus Korarchaeota archaeon]
MKGSKREIVVPGENLGVVEEYIPGEGIREEDGNLYSVYLGSLFEKEVKLSVRPLKRTILPLRPGEIALGEIRGADRQIYHIHLTALIKPRRAILSPPVSATMSKRPPNVGARPSDIVLVKVSSVKNGTVAVTMGGPPELGVLLSFCPVCGTPLKKGVGYTLVCRSCGKVYLDRKISSMYGWNPFKEGLISYVKREK